MKSPFRRMALALAASSLSLAALPQTAQPQVHIIYLGGDDCPPCVAWRAEQLPKLERTDAFKSVKFSFVLKSIRSPVPAAFFLPAEVRPYKDKLDIASGRNGGSPQFAVLVNGEVFDYYFGTRSAESVERMIEAIREGTRYPFNRCVKLGPQWRCVEPRS